MANDRNRSHWNQSGQTWVAHQRTYDCMLQPIGDLLVECAALPAGERALDVGCGYGTTAAALADLDVTVHGIDISEPMIAAARQRVPSATFQVADAQTDALGGPFDSVISRFGVMFFDDPGPAFTNIARHTVEGGRLTFVCWNDQRRSTAAWAGGELIRAALPSPPPPPHPHAPGPFAFADPDRTQQLLTEAGWTEISIAPHEMECSIGWPESNGVEERLALVLSAEVGQLLRDQIPAEEHPALIEATRRSLQERVVDGAVRLEASIWLVSATRR